ncbi:GFA family protein [Sphingomonas hankyongi]|uniref:GFA family protein n=1 Tax=Sphingomonas hankyongi TaxID=2908209 RepID=A0ABT0RZZ4_9SPHN|nr:GFA family protein [Sphingomonas hankyongi]MCL6729157.1 GFA family protein [Sphingomonas hankyongi]
MSFEANCHCGAVSVTVDAEIPGKAVMCNCSHCSIKSLVLGAVPGSAVSVNRGEDQLETYQFNRHVIDHRFCKNCGVQPFAQGKGPDGSSMAMINLRCVPEADLETIEIVHYDGASL